MGIINSDIEKHLEEFGKSIQNIIYNDETKAKVEKFLGENWIIVYTKCKECGAIRILIADKKYFKDCEISLRNMLNLDLWLLYNMIIFSHLLEVEKTQLVIYNYFVPFVIH